MITWLVRWMMSPTRHKIYPMVFNASVYNAVVIRGRALLLVIRVQNHGVELCLQNVLCHWVESTSLPWCVEGAIRYVEATFGVGGDVRTSRKGGLR